MSCWYSVRQLTQEPQMNWSNNLAKRGDWGHDKTFFSKHGRSSPMTLYRCTWPAKTFKCKTGPSRAAVVPQNVGRTQERNSTTFPFTHCEVKRFCISWCQLIDTHLPGWWAWHTRCRETKPRTWCSLSHQHCSCSWWHWALRDTLWKRATHTETFINRDFLKSHTRGKESQWTQNGKLHNI